MPYFKHTMIFRLTTAKRVGGWSEQLYTSGSDVAVELGFLRDRAQKRAALLPQSASVIGLKVQQVDPPGNGSATSDTYPGVTGNKNDVPQMALYFRVAGQGGPASRQLVLRGIPDDQVKEGEYAGDTAFNSALILYLNSLSIFRMRSRDRTAPAFDIQSIDTNGVVQLAVDPSALATGDLVELLRVTNAAGQAVGGQYRVASVNAGLRTVTLINYRGGQVYASGQIRKVAYLYPLIIPPATPLQARVVVRKVGRPSDVYRGRNSRRRRSQVVPPAVTP